MSSTPYDRQISFALQTAENPKGPLNGSDLDAEFNAVKLALDDTQQNLAKIQDDDGALARGSVGRAQFDSSITLGFAAPKQWAEGILWDADISTCFHNSIFYICNTTHTSTNVFDAAKWDEIADFTAAVAIADGSITSAKLADGAITANKIADGSISNLKLATGAVTTSKLADQQVTTPKIAPAAITLDKLASGVGLPAGLGPLPWSLPTLPDGWDWADGDVLLPSTPYQTLRQSYIEAGFPFGQDGSGNPKKPDARGRVAAGMDNLGLIGSANRLVAGSMASVRHSLGGAGGADTITLTSAQMPNHAHANTLTDPGHVHGGIPATSGVQANAPPGGNCVIGTTNSSSATTGITINNASTGGGNAHDNMPPTILCGMIIKAH